ncbi:hypothetical protein ACFGVR_12775 [Mucilaginibacter sp. AW1-3]
MNKPVFAFVCFVFLFATAARSQTTAGIGSVVAVESAAKRITANNATLKLYADELVELQAAWQKKIQALNDEYAALIKERDALIGDMKIGAKCSQCGEYKSSFEKRGVNFEKHLGEVKGYAVPATTTELETTRAKYRDLLAYKKVQIQTLTQGGDKSVVAKQKEIDALKTQNQTLCTEITTHSQTYAKSVEAEVKAKHDTWIDDLMNYASAILIADDKITIGKARVVAIDAAFAKKSEEIKELVKTQVAEKQKAAEGKITINIEKLKNLDIAAKEYLEPLSQKLNGLKQDLADANSKLVKLGLKDTARISLATDVKRLIAEIGVTSGTIKSYTTSYNANVLSLNTENKVLKDQNWQLTVNLAKMQAAEIAKVKPGYDQQKITANALAATATTQLASARLAFTAKGTAYKTLNNTYESYSIAESNRMFIAAQGVGCSVFNDARTFATLNWNKIYPCVSGVTTMAKPYNSNVFGTYCASASSPNYLANYKSFLRGLAGDDLAAVKGNSNATWFEKVSQ